MRWIVSKLPDRDSLLANRWLRPFAHRLSHPLLWHLNRRSAARGLALGLFAGLILPFGQIVLAALLAFSARANIIVAASATFVTNPLTFPPIYFAAYWLGRNVTGAASTDSGHAHARSAVTWLLDVAAPTVTGLVLLALATSTLGYALVHICWRWRVSRRWSRRLNSRRLATESVDIASLN
ncbi:DUF2062 domain-containing protein [Sphingomonas mucosissima]|uniref:DUF2062 domain-containing protein n=1 Tax=Sphingomonas mucosissima TaxID=370959 RepID=A0A245ZEZ1_9SPHN|nr:DUF2062 domain-containing protein [Sphingomonas mucosissima]OWK28307.1 hypothetical protein SPMU_31630 [Sphingomonas mucosissima]